jgi:hypothetical protein
MTIVSNSSTPASAASRLSIAASGVAMIAFLLVRVTYATTVRRKCCSHIARIHQLAPDAHGHF